MKVEPIDFVCYEAADLIREHPPIWQHPNKEVVYEIACSSGFPFSGEVVYVRWPAQTLPNSVPEPLPITVCSGVFEYAVPTDSLSVEWHMNFADPSLFVVYGSRLLAQDELQVAEHPVLGSLREALIAQDMIAETVDALDNPTPVTVTGVQRRCVINTLPNPEIGCPNGLYGNAFAAATEKQVRTVTAALTPPTVSNILAMAAIPGGYGEYSRKEILSVLTTAYTGFLAAHTESRRLLSTVTRTVIHTGFWGCGAFGGNRSLMVMLQKLAGDLAGVELVFWAFDESGVRLADAACQRVVQMYKTADTLDEVVNLMVHEKFKWGISDGN